MLLISEPFGSFLLTQEIKMSSLFYSLAFKTYGKLKPDKTHLRAASQKLQCPWLHGRTSYTYTTICCTSGDQKSCRTHQNKATEAEPAGRGQTRSQIQERLGDCEMFSNSANFQSVGLQEDVGPRGRSRCLLGQFGAAVVVGDDIMLILRKDAK